MVAYIESEREEYVVPNEHLHFGLFAWIYRHYVTVDYGHCAAGCRRYKVTVDLHERKV